MDQGLDEGLDEALGKRLAEKLSVGKREESGRELNVREALVRE